MRIGINISEDLREKMKPLMATSNISQICRDAIKAYVQSYERAQERARLERMADVAERLAKEMTPLMVDWETLGLEDGKIWVQLAKPKDFERLNWYLDMAKDHGESPYSVRFNFVQGSKSFSDRENEHKDWQEWVNDTDDDVCTNYYDAKAQYEQAYLNYILAVWDMVKQRISANIATTQKRYKEAREKSLEDGLKGGNLKADSLAEQQQLEK